LLIGPDAGDDGGCARCSTSGAGRARTVADQAGVPAARQVAHPDAGGSDEHYRRIAEARDALLGHSAGWRSA